MSVILITGAYRGLGLATAKVLADGGHRVFLTARDASKAEKAAIVAGAESFALDVTSAESRDAAVKEIAGRTGVLDALINNAAIQLDGGKDPARLSGESLDLTFATNVIAPLQLIQAFLPLLRKSKSPRIVNVSSGSGQMHGDVTPWAAAYSASKSALNMLSRHLAATLPGIAVNCVCPGWCRTEMGGANAPRSAEQGADTIAWLAADAPHKLTGKFFRDRKEIPW